MTEMTDVYAALQKADAAGDTAGAKQLADYIRTSNPTETPAAPAAQPSPGVMGYAGGALETLGQVGTGLVATPAAGLSGLGTMAGRALGLTNADPADVVRNVQNKLTYQPRSQGGQAISNVVSYLPSKLAQGADYVGGGVASATGSPALGAAANTGIQALPLLLGGRFLGRTAAPAEAIAPEVQSAVSAGIKLTPEQAQSGFIGRAAQSLSGSAKLERGLSRTNAETVDTLSQQEIGTNSLSPAALQQAKEPYHAVMDQVKSIGSVPLGDTFNRAVSSGGAGTLRTAEADALRQHYTGMPDIDAADALADIRQLRADATKNIKAPFAPAQNSLGYVQRQIATALEDQIDRHIQSLPNVPSDLIPQLRDARVSLAKIHSVEDAMEGPNVSARLLNKQPYLSGNLKTISDAYENFPRALQDVSRIRDSGPFGVLDYGFGVAGGLGHPGFAAAILARPMVRAAIGSKLYQNAAIGRKSLFSPTSPALSGAASSIPALTQEQQPGGLPDAIAAYLAK